MLTERGPGRKSSSERRAELAQAALDLMDEVGPEGVTTTAISRRVGLSQAAVFKHFRNKDEIWAAAMDALGARISPRLAAVARGPGTPLERVNLLVKEYLALVAENPAITAFLFYRLPPSGDRTLRDRVAERFGRLRGLIRRLLGEGREQGLVSADLDLDDGADLVIGVVQGLLARSHVERRPVLAEEPDRLFALIVAGLRR